MISGTNIQNAETAFLIEGAFTLPTYPEVKLAKALAQKRGCQVFNPIQSYTAYHLAEYFFENIHDEEKIKQALTHIIMDEIIEENTLLQNKRIIRELISKPFARLLNEKKIAQIPDFIDNLEKNPSFQNLTKFIKEGEKSTPENNEFKNIRLLIENEITALSNKLSQAELIRFLNEKKDIKFIFGLVGSCHLPMLSNLGKTIIISEKKIDNDNEFYWQGHYHVQIIVEERMINIHLFGGAHGTNDAYNMMESFVGNSLQKIPSNHQLPNNHVSVSAAPHSVLFTVNASDSNPPKTINTIQFKII